MGEVDTRFSDQNGVKITPFEAAKKLYRTDIMEYPPGVFLDDLIWLM